MAWTAVFTEDWVGDNGDPWDSGRWTVGLVGAGATADIQTNRGRMSASTSFNEVNATSSVGTLDAVAIDYTIEFPTTDDQWSLTSFFHDGLWSGERPNNAYAFEVRPSGARLRLYKFINGDRSTIREIPTFSLTAATPYSVRIECEPDGATNNIRIKIWEAGTTEPGAWTIDEADSDLSSGGVGVSYMSGTAAGADEVFYNDFVVYEDAAAVIPVPNITAVTAQSSTELQVTWEDGVA